MVTFGKDQCDYSKKSIVELEYFAGSTGTFLNAPISLFFDFYRGMLALPRIYNHSRMGASF